MKEKICVSFNAKSTGPVRHWRELDSLKKKILKAYHLAKIFEDFFLVPPPFLPPLSSYDSFFFYYLFLNMLATSCNGKFVFKLQLYYFSCWIIKITITLIYWNFMAFIRSSWFSNNFIYISYGCNSIF